MKQYRTFLVVAVLVLAGMGPLRTCRAEARASAVEISQAVTAHAEPVSERLERARQEVRDRSSADEESPAGAGDGAILSVGGRMMRALIFCVGVFLIGAGIHRRLGKGQGGAVKRRVRILERTPLSPKTQLCLVEVDGRELLLSTGQDRVCVIRDLRPDMQSPELDYIESLDGLCEREMKYSA